LPSLPSRNAILLGWASELPVLVQMNYLKEEHSRNLNDPDFWDVWTRRKEGLLTGKTVADEWQNAVRK
jgi:hypothetical protein